MGCVACRGRSKEWQRIDVAIDMAVREGEPGSDSRKVDVVKPVQEIVPAKVEPAVVSDVKIGDDSVSFTVDKVGVPVLVRVSYFLIGKFREPKVRIALLQT